MKRGVEYMQWLGTSKRTAAKAKAMPVDNSGDCAICLMLPDEERLGSGKRKSQCRTWCRQCVRWMCKAHHGPGHLQRLSCGRPVQIR